MNAIRVAGTAAIAYSTQTPEGSWCAKYASSIRPKAMNHKT